MIYDRRTDADGCIQIYHMPEPVIAKMQRSIAAQALGYDPYGNDLQALMRFMESPTARQVNPIIAINGRFYDLSKSDGFVDTESIKGQLADRIWLKSKVAT